MKEIYFYTGLVVVWAVILAVTVLLIILICKALWQFLWTKVDISTVWVIITGKHKEWGANDIFRTKGHRAVWGTNKSILGRWKMFLIRQLLKPHEANHPDKTR